MKKIPVRSIQSAENNKIFFESFKIRNVHDVLGGKDMSQDLHRHDFFFVLALKKGDGTHEIDFNAYKISNCSIFFMRPGQVHRLALKAESEGYLMEFKKDFFHLTDRVSDDLLRKAGNENFRQLDERSADKLQTILIDIFDEYHNREDGFQEAIKAKLSIFFIELVRRQQNKQVSPGSVNQYAQERLQDFVNLLELHICTHKQVSQYAEMLSLSQFQLHSITKTLLGKTATELIIDHIILEAKRNLLATSNQVNQIAYHLGYEDVSYFIRFFKKHTEYTPEAFRQNFR
jgi:AraC-like DNA-binding protein